MGSGFSIPLRCGRRSRKPKYRSVGVQTDPIMRSIGVQTDFPDDDDHDYNVHAKPNHTTGGTQSIRTQADPSVDGHPHAKPNLTTGGTQSIGTQANPSVDEHPDHHDPEPSIPKRFSSAEKGKGKEDSDKSGPSCYRPPPHKHFFQTTRPQPHEDPTSPYHHPHPHYFYQDTRGVEDECRRFDEMPYGYYNYNYDPTPYPEWHGQYYTGYNDIPHHDYRGYYDIPHEDYTPSRPLDNPWSYESQGRGQNVELPWGEKFARPLDNPRSYEPQGHGQYVELPWSEKFSHPLDNPWSYEPQGHGQNVELPWREKFAMDAVAQLFGGANPYYYDEIY